MKIFWITSGIITAIFLIALLVLIAASGMSAGIEILIASIALLVMIAGGNYLRSITK